MINFDVYSRVLDRIGSPIVTGLDEVQQRHGSRLQQLQAEKDADPLLNTRHSLPLTAQISNAELRQLLRQLSED